MRSIVTDRERDYIFASDFDVLAQHLDEVVTDMCPDGPTPPPLRTLQFIHFFFSVLVGFPQNSPPEYFTLLCLVTVSANYRSLGSFFVYKYPANNRKQPAC